MAAKASVARRTPSRLLGGEFEFEFESTPKRWFGPIWIILAVDPRVLRVWDSSAHVRRRSNRPGMAAKASVARRTPSRLLGGEFEFEIRKHIETVWWIILAVDPRVLWVWDS